MAETYMAETYDNAPNIKENPFRASIAVMASDGRIFTVHYEKDEDYYVADDNDVHIASPDAVFLMRSRWFEHKLAQFEKDALEWRQRAADAAERELTWKLKYEAGEVPEPKRDLKDEIIADLKIQRGQLALMNRKLTEHLMAHPVSPAGDTYSYATPHPSASSSADRDREIGERQQAEDELTIDPREIGA
jgi:hypothetical protein